MNIATSPENLNPVAPALPLGSSLASIGVDKVAIELHTATGTLLNMRPRLRTQINKENITVPFSVKMTKLSDRIIKDPKLMALDIIGHMKKKGISYKETLMQNATLDNDLSDLAHVASKKNVLDFVFSYKHTPIMTSAGYLFKQVNFWVHVIVFLEEELDSFDQVIPVLFKNNIEPLVSSHLES